MPRHYEDKAAIVQAQALARAGTPPPTIPNITKASATVTWTAGTPASPLPHTKQAQDEEIPDPTGSNRRFRQERIIVVDQDQTFPYGDLHRPKTPGYDRLFWCNPNGISPHRDLLDFQEIARSMRDAQTDLFGLPEPNLDWLRPEIRKQC
jgi:hypothetical protein